MRRLVARVQSADPDVIENHNLHGFDLPFLDRRARRLGVPLALGRIGPPGLRQRAARRGVAAGPASDRRIRFVAPGRELIDTLDAVLRHDFATRDLPGHGLKAVARHLGLAGPDRELIPGDRIYDGVPARPGARAALRRARTSRRSRVWRGCSAAPRSRWRAWRRAATSGSPTPARRPACIDPLLVRAYLRAGAALPAHQPGDGTPHSGAALHLFATGVAQRVVKADVASLYPSLMRAYRIGPARDRLWRAARAGRSAGRAAARREGERPGRPAGIGRAPHPRGDVGGDEARRELGLRLPRAPAAG